MIINEETLYNFHASDDFRDNFVAEYQNGLDISGLWGTDEEAHEVWAFLFSSSVWRAEIGWAICAGLLPARIRANLIGADLSGVNLIEANMWKANLDGADLKGADLEGANLWGANLTGADIRGANLSGVDLSDANLSGTDLRWADLSFANLYGADLRGARYNQDTVFPSGFDAAGAEMTEVTYDH